MSRSHRREGGTGTKQQQSPKAWEIRVRNSRTTARKMSSAVAPAEDSPPPAVSSTTTTIIDVERPFPGGEVYTGGWSPSSDCPHGDGKYVWSDGCMYEGGWEMGRAAGRGRFSWPSGATYEGHFRSGLMDGKGTYTGPRGDTYRGGWVRNFRHGSGSKSYANGDYYEGEWRRGLQDGFGRYQWRSGAAYAGAWRSGNMLGATAVDLPVCPCEKIPVFPSQKMAALAPAPPPPPPRQSVLPVAARQGVTIARGHKNFELMLNLQLGIRHSVGRPAPATNSLDLKSSAFDPREKVWTKFPPEGSKHTPPHSSCDFRWKDYCPAVFRALRKLFKVDPADYMISICGNDALRELSSPGKSGSFFYLTNDDRYMIKTMKKSEVKVLLRMLPAYYKHVRAFDNTLVTKFYGLHCVRLTGATQKKVRFVIMGNLFCSEYTIHRRFDLKGSSHGRLTDKPESEINATTTLKDLDLNYVFRLQKAWFHDFCRQVERDCDFLEQERIMDYSLLVGLHFRETSPGVATTGPKLSRSDIDKLPNPARLCPIVLGIGMPARAERTVRRNDFEPQLVGETTGELYDVVMFFNIIDILQDYDISKKLEHAYKSFQYDATSISAVDPKQYAKRFRDFIFRIFVEDT